MTALILDGKSLALTLEDELRSRVEKIKAVGGAPLKLATILVGDDPSSMTYVRMKGNACKRVGLEPVFLHLDSSTTTVELMKVIQGLNDDPEVHGILLQHPMPHQIDERACFDCIAIEKDTDGVTSHGFGKMAMGGRAFGSATPAGIMRILKHYAIPTAGIHAVVVGRSAILGKPMAAMLLNGDATVTICHSRTRDLEKHVKAAELIVAAVGRPEFIPSEWISDHAVVVDAGYHAGGVGDIKVGDGVQRWRAYTPVPGGVGPMTISTLIANTVESAERHVGLE